MTQIRTFLSVSALVYALRLDGVNAQQSFLGHLTSIGTEELSPGYIIGSRWAISTGSSIQRMSQENLLFIVGDESYDIELIKYYNPVSDGILPTYDIDLAIFKVVGRTDEHGAVAISADYPEEGDEVSAVLEDGSLETYIVAPYRDCEARTGLAAGAFCLLHPPATLPPGTGLFSEGMLTGLTSDTQAPGGMYPVTAIAPATFWIIDVMAEYTPRSPSPKIYLN